jgi:hypothetical protein
VSKSIRNTTTGALKVPLPHGKALHLGPHQSGQISHHDIDHPPLKKLLDEGKIEIEDLEDNEAVPEHGRRGEKPYEG